MAKVNVILNDEYFGIQPNVPVMHQVVTAQLAKRRAGTQSTKTRSEVRGGGRKPYRQKGTGNARQGSTRAPHFSGGGVALGPKPRSYAQRTPKKMIKLALRSALSDRAADSKVIVVDAWGWANPSTKDAAKALAALGVDGRSLVVIERGDATAALSFRNIPEVQLCHVGELNAYDVLCNDWIVFSRASLATFEASVVGDASTRTSTTVSRSAASAASPAAESEVRGFGAVADTATVGEWAGSATANEDGSQPEGFAIKGNADSMLYHLPDGRWYDNTVAEYWFDTEEAAKAAGFTKAGTKRTADAVTASAPDRSDDDATTGVGSASHEPPAQPDASASEQEGSDA